MKMRLALLLVLTVLPLPAYAQTFGAEEFTLENGMQVVVIPNHRAPVVTHMMWMKVGAADEKPGVSGMAHYLEHLLFKGTASVAPGEFSKIVKTLGGNDNAFTGQDYTAYYESIAVDNLEQVMKMDADRMMNANPPPEHFTSEKAVVIEERRQRTDNDPRAIFAEQLNAALFVNHPYATPIVGWMAEIEKYEWKDVKAFYDAWYAPNNAVLVVSGDMTAEKLKPLAEKYYGPLKPKTLPVRMRPQVPPAIASTTLELQDPAIHQNVYQKLYLAPSMRMNRADSLALDVLSEIIDGGPTTRLYKSLVVDAKKATDVGFSYSSAALDYARISAVIVPAEGVDVKETASLLNTEIRKVISEGVTDKEVADAVQRLRDEAIFARDSVSGPAMIFGAALMTGNTVKDVENWTEEVSKVTAQQVKDVAAKYLDDEKPWIRPPVEGFLRPTPPPAQQPEEEVKTDVEG